jgi:hypothetical protein
MMRLVIASDAYTSCPGKANFARNRRQLIGSIALHSAQAENMKSNAAMTEDYEDDFL